MKKIIQAIKLRKLKTEVNKKGIEKICEYCKLLSGDWTILAEDGETELKIERHNKEYSLVAEGLTDIAETRINYYPMCGRELKKGGLTYD